MKNDKNSFVKGVRAYVVAGHIVWVIATPLIVFIGGGSWLINRFDWDYRLIIVFVLLGFVFMAAGVWSYGLQLLNMYGGLDDLKNKKKSEPKDKKDYDY